LVAGAPPILVGKPERQPLPKIPDEIREYEAELRARPPKPEPAIPDRPDFIPDPHQDDDQESDPGDFDENGTIEAAS